MKKSQQLPSVRLINFIFKKHTQHTRYDIFDYFLSTSICFDFDSTRVHWAEWISESKHRSLYDVLQFKIHSISQRLSLFPPRSLTRSWYAHDINRLRSCLAGRIQIVMLRLCARLSSETMNHLFKLIAMKMSGEGSHWVVELDLAWKREEKVSKVTNVIISYSLTCNLHVCTSVKYLSSQIGMAHLSRTFN